MTDQVCHDHSRLCDAVATLRENEKILFRKMDRIYFSVLGLLAAVIVDIMSRIPSVLRHLAS